VASGVFNVKLKADVKVWDDYMAKTIETMASLATRGFAFNALTSYSDPRNGVMISTMRIRCTGSITVSESIRVS